jgi:hypothetical protein
LSVRSILTLQFCSVPHAKHSATRTAHFLNVGAISRVRIRCWWRGGLPCCAPRAERLRRDCCRSRGTPQGHSGATFHCSEQKTGLCACDQCHCPYAFDMFSKFRDMLVYSSCSLRLGSQESGLKVTSLSGDFTVSVKATDTTANVGPVDLVIVGCKAWQVILSHLLLHQCHTSSSERQRLRRGKFFEGSSQTLTIPFPNPFLM